jgi:hypothetical protein
LFGYLVIPGLGSALAFATFFSAIYFMVMAMGLITPMGQSKWRLCAVPEPGNNLCGFLAFRTFFSTLVSAALAIIFGLLLMMLQNQYLRDPGSRDIFTFLFVQGKDGWAKLVNSDLSSLAGNVLGWLFEPGLVLYQNPQFGIGLVVYAFVFVACVAGAWMTLNVGARDARDWSLKNLVALSPEIGRAPGDVGADLEKMTFWPIGWISLNQLLALLLTLLVAIFSYRIALLFAAWAFVKSLDLIWGFVKKPFKTRGHTTE